MIAEKLLQLPGLVNVKTEHGQMDFYLTVFKNGTRDIRLCYQPLDISFMWENVYIENRNTNYLYLVENISDDASLIRAINETKSFLIKNKLITVPKIKDLGNGVYAFDCPGCGQEHRIPTKTPLPNNAIWSFDGNLEKPTFVPSINLAWGREANPDWQEPAEPGNWSGRCHFFVRDGMIDYCPDSTHALSGIAGVPMFVVLSSY